jgi:hypothetical protein
MSRGIAIFSFWLLGFGIGFIGYLSLPGIADWFSTVLPQFVNQAIIGALIAGMVGSAVSTCTVVTWANRTAP